jgi:hypothetical protein
MNVAPPIVKVAERLMLDIERCVGGFTRSHKFAIGLDLRASARSLALLAHRAWRQRDQQRQRVDELVWAVDDMKIVLQLACQLRAFASFGQFEAVMRTARDLGRQVGAWNRQLNPKGQNAAPVPAGQRTQILSTRAASHHEATP